jgi:hypothetical protein
MPDRDDELPDDLIDAVELLRVEEPMRAEWREGVLRRAALPAKARISLSVPWAIAAGLLCAIVGGAATIVATRSVSAPGAAQVAQAPPVPQVAPGSSAMLPVRFSVVAPNAASVSIVGDFNAWNPATLPMKRSADGKLWEVEVRLPLGRYPYAFMVDGRIEPDPAAPRTTDDGFGTPNSVLMVRGS